MKMRTFLALAALSADLVAADISLRSIPMSTRLKAGPIQKRCKAPLQDPSDDFPCQFVDLGSALYCPQGRLRWDPITLDDQGCPTGTRKGAEFTVKEGLVTPPEPDVAYRARWIESGAISPVVLRASRVIGALHDTHQVVLWSLDGRQRRFRNHLGDVLSICSPTMHPRFLEDGNGSTWVRRQGARWEVINLEFPNRTPPKYRRSSDVLVLGIVDRGSTPRLLHWAVQSWDTLRGPRIEVLDSRKQVLDTLEPNSSTPLRMTGTADATNFPDSVLIRVSDATGLKGSSLVLADSVPRHTMAPPSPKHAGDPTWSLVETRGPWVFAFQDQLYWGTGNIGQRTVRQNPTHPGERWSWRFDMDSPDGTYQEWMDSDKIPRLDKVRILADTIRFTMTHPRHSTCLSIVFSPDSRDGIPLGPGVDWPLSPEDTPWGPCDTRVTIHDFMNAAGWWYRYGAYPQYSPAPNFRSGNRNDAMPIPATVVAPKRFLASACPEARGEFRITRPTGMNAGGRLEAYGIGEDGKFAFSLDLPNQATDR